MLSLLGLKTILDINERNASGRSTTRACQGNITFYPSSFWTEYSRCNQLRDEGDKTLRLTFDGVLLPLPGLLVFDEASSSASIPEGDL